MVYNIIGMNHNVNRFLLFKKLSIAETLEKSICEYNHKGDKRFEKKSHLLA